MTTSNEPEQRPAHKVDRRQQRRLIAATIIGGLVAAFAVLNTGSVKVDWIVTTSSSPLIIVILVAFILGMAFDRLLLYRQRRRQSHDPPE